MKVFLAGSFSINEEDDMNDVDILVELDYSQPKGTSFIICLLVHKPDQ